MKIDTAKKSGFTLIELMIVIAIVAVLVALALPGYGYFVKKARRADAQADLLHFVGVAQRVFTERNTFDHADIPDVDLWDTVYYDYTLTVPLGGASYTITAKPKPGFDQDDDDCGTMTITETGLKTKTGSDSRCW
jgi:type IV pilus assembly protein PilE